MPASSKSQQRFMGMVHALQKGEISPDSVSGKVRDVAQSIDYDDAEDFASTKHKGKPEKVKQETKVRNLIRKMVREIMNELNETRVKLASKKDVNFHGNIAQLVGKKHSMGLDKKSLLMLLKALRKHASITFNEGKLNEAKVITLPNGVKVKISFGKVTLSDTRGKIELDRGELQKFGNAVKKHMGVREGGKGSGRKAKPGSAKDIENKAMSAADAANAKMDAAEKAMKKKKKKKNEGKLSEAKKVKYKANDWKKINKIAKKKDVMIQSAFGDEFKWEEGSRHGVFASESNGREIELTHDDIDVLVIESKLSEATIRLSRDRDAAFHGNIMQLIGKKHKMGMDKKSVKALFKAISQYMRMTFEQVKLTEGKSLTLPNGIKVKIGMDGLELKDSGGRIKLDRKELEILGRAAKKQMGVRESLTGAFKTVWQDVNKGLASQAGDHEDDEDEDNDDKAILHGIKEGMNKRKAAEILKQIGGNRFIAMTGAKGFAFSDKYMSFKIGRNSKGINFVRIGHNANDLYNMEFGFVSTRGIKVKKKVKDVYADMLGTIFTKYTGMHVRL